MLFLYLTFVCNIFVVLFDRSNKLFVEASQDIQMLCACTEHAVHFGGKFPITPAVADRRVIGYIYDNCRVRTFRRCTDNAVFARQPTRSRPDMAGKEKIDVRTSTTIFIFIRFPAITLILNKTFKTGFSTSL